MDKPTILTGIRANNDLQLGNYFGAILPMIDMAKHHSDQYQINLFVPDLHSFTTPTDLSILQKAVTSNLRVYVAAGLTIDNANVHIYRQSYVPAHSELTWILSCFTGFGEMSRMTQFKDKSTKIKEDRISVGLFSYPILMAADILLYGASYVPVGDDQTQHLEFARDIATRFNTMATKYGYQEPFIIPEPVKKQHGFFGKDQGLRIMDLVDPTKKMSKSDELGKGVIFLSDAPEIAKKKVMSATTDDKATVAYNPAEQPGISNLLEILSLFRQQPILDVAAEFAGMTSYGEFKSIVADEVEKFLVELQANINKVDDDAIQKKLEYSEALVNEQANHTLHKIQRVVGLRPAGK